MTDLRVILLQYVPALLESGCAQVIEAPPEETMGNAWLTLERNGLIWRLVRDRSQIILECRPVASRSNTWYTLDLLRALVSGERMATGLLTEESAGWLSGHLDEVDRRFSPATLPGTLETLKRLMRIRAKELFG